MPWCSACESNCGTREFSRNQLSKIDPNRRCSACVSGGRTVGFASRQREAQRAAEVRAAEERALAEAHRAAEEARRIAADEEEAARRHLQEERLAREDRERREREARDAARERRLLGVAEDILRRQLDLAALRGTFQHEVALLPPTQRSRFIGPVAQLSPLQDWHCATAIAWFDEAFSFSDLYRASFIRNRIDGRMLELASDRLLRDDLGIGSEWHRAHILRALTVLKAPPEGTAPPGAGSAGSSGSSGKRKRDDAAVGLCIVCTAEDAAVACVPCGHMCACEACSKKLGAMADTRCPVCRSHVDRTVRVYL